MNETQACLKHEQLRKLMECELAAADVAQAEEHLSVCEHCRAMLDRAIGNTDWWQEARESLGHGEGDRAVAEDAKSAHGDVLALLGPTDDPHMLGRVGAYEVFGVLGRGGMGVVFKGFDAALNRYVAIKMLLPHLAASGAARKRFAREAQAAAAVVHDHVMAIHSVAEWQGVPYLVMPYGRGVSLQRRLSDNGPLGVREILRIGMQTAAGLAAAHAQGLVHRDVKPANILLAEDVERVTLTDFGLARAVDDASLTRSGALAGTPQYMSPEQARSEAVDARSDLFSLGGVLYAMCTGRSPFRSDSSYGVLRLITDDEPTPIREINPEIPEWLCAIVGRLMAKRPEDRFSSAIELAELLEGCLAHVQQPTAAALPASLSPSKGVSFSKRQKHLFTGVIVMFLTLAMGLAAMLAWQGTAPPDIAGEWTGEDWGVVVLEATQPGHYEGTYNDIDHSKSGTMHLKWSRVERRFNGAWGTTVSVPDGGKVLLGGEGDDKRRGKISLRLVDNEIRGAWTTKKSSAKESESVRLADLLWKRRGDGAVKTADAAAEGKQQAEPEAGSSVLGAQGDDSLEGVWELALPPDIEAERPEEQRLRLVFSNGWYGTFRGSQRVSVSRVKVEPEHKPKRIVFVDRITFGEGESMSMRGIFEVIGDGLRLRVAADTLALPTEFGVEHPEFKRAKGQLAQEQLEALKRHSTRDGGESVNPTLQAAPIPGAPTGDADPRSAPARTPASYDADEELTKNTVERRMLDFICQEAYLRVAAITSLEYAFETKDAEGWHAQAEFHANKERFLVKRQDVTGMWVSDKRLKPMSCSSAFNGVRQQYLDENLRLRLKTGVAGASYSITTPQQYMFMWLQGSSDDFRWDTIQHEELWKKRFAEASYVGAIPKDGRTLEIVDFPQPGGLTPCVYRVFFARELGFIPIKYLRRVSASTETSTTMEVTELESVATETLEFGMPLELTFTESGADGVSLRQRLTVTVDSESLRINQPLDDSLFTIDPALAKQTYDVDVEDALLKATQR